ncbi:MAG: magnesium transporter [Vicinamibacterales bacterium]
MSEHLLYLTELVGLEVHDTRGRRIGRIRDAGLVPRVDPARVDQFLVGGDLAWLTVRHDQVARIGLDGIFLRDDRLVPHYEDEYVLRMVRDLLDQQIIDVHGRKVVRVNDVTFEIRQSNDHATLRVVEVDVGVRSMARRLVKGILPPRTVRRLQEAITPRSIRWEFCNILEPDPQRRLRLNISHRALENLHPADLADIVEELSPEDREAIFRELDSEVAAEALSEIDPRMQVQILESLEADRAADIVEDMAPDQAADVLGDMEEETSERILGQMEVEEKAEVQELLEHPEDSAGGMMNTEFLLLPIDATVDDALAALRKNEELADQLHTLFLHDETGRLAGVVALPRLLLVPPGTRLADVANPNVVSTTVDEKADRAIELVDKYNLTQLPVLGEDGEMVGIITADDVISYLRRD